MHISIAPLSDDGARTVFALRTEDGPLSLEEALEAWARWSGHQTPLGGELHVRIRAEAPHPREAARHYEISVDRNFLA